MTNSAHDEMHQGPLSGMVVVECASIILGPMTSRYLAEMGADVIKIEAPEGDLTRRIGPETSPGMAALFMGSNKNKRSVVLDLKDQDSREALYRIVEGADVFLHSNRTSAAEKLGLSYEAIQERNPDIVYCQVQGFSDDGPYAGQPAYDDIIQSLSGLAMLQTAVTGEPRYVPTILADKITAVHAVSAIAMALLHRERTGQGQAVRVPMFETMAAFNLVEHQWGHMFEPPIGEMGYVPVATGSRRPFKTRDGYIAVMPYSDAQWHRFFEISGQPEVMEDPRFATHAARQVNIVEAWAQVGQQVLKRSTDEWLEILSIEDIPYARVNAMEDLSSDPHLTAVNFWETVQGEIGSVKFPRHPVRFSESRLPDSQIPPRLGEHTSEVLRQAGLSEAEVEAITGKTRRP